LACPNYPECKFTKPVPEDEVTQPCPKCGGKLVKRLSKKGKKFYGCASYPDCDFASPGLPTGDICDKCGSYIISGLRGRKYCMNSNCPSRNKDKKEK
jgi:DNA topoisomerase-1